LCSGLPDFPETNIPDLRGKFNRPDSFSVGQLTASKHLKGRYLCTLNVVLNINGTSIVSTISPTNSRQDNQSEQKSTKRNLRITQLTGKKQENE